MYSLSRLQRRSSKERHRRFFLTQQRCQLRTEWQGAVSKGFWPDLPRPLRSIVASCTFSNLESARCHTECLHRWSTTTAGPEEGPRITRITGITTQTRKISGKNGD